MKYEDYLAVYRYKFRPTPEQYKAVRQEWIDEYEHFSGSFEQWLQSKIKPEDQEVQPCKEA